MAIKVARNRYFAEEVVRPNDLPTLGEELTDIRSGGFGRWMYCKYCYKDVCPVASHENVSSSGATRQALCSECGAGLSPCEPVDQLGSGGVQ
jgi:hypothetical protein